MPEKHIRGLDSLRFVAALWVVISHTNQMAGELVHRNDWMARAINGLYHNLFNGAAAVIVFFLVSGFCIHYPNQNPRGFSISAFITKRLVRVGLPILVITFVCFTLKFSFYEFYSQILWSLYAELIYYLLYPALRWLRFSFGWAKLLPIAFAASFCVILKSTPYSDYHSQGIGLTWILGLPVWLLGCLLAETKLTCRRNRFIWIIRLSIWGLSTGCAILRFHTPITYAYSLTFFGVIAFFWLKSEIELFLLKKPIKILEWAGKWSYSIYLVHVLVIHVWSPFCLTRWDGPANLGLTLIFTLSVAYVFFVFFEKPSHQLASALGSQVKNFVQNVAQPHSIQSCIHKLSYFILSFLILLSIHALSRGGSRYFASKFKTIRQNYQEWKNEPGKVILIGDSQIDNGDWDKLIPNMNIENRGRGGNTTAGILENCQSIISAKPKTLILLVGINDLRSKVNTDTITANYSEILKNFKRQLPQSLVIVIGILPVNEKILNETNISNDSILKVNRKISLICQEQHFEFIDASTLLMNSIKQLDIKYTDDGLHLNPEGYLRLKNELIRYLSTNSH